MGTFLFILNQAILSSTQCFKILPQIYYDINGFMWVLSLVFQFETLILIFFERVQRVFENTPLRLSKCITNIHYFGFFIFGIQNVTITIFIFGDIGSGFVKLMLSTIGFIITISLTSSLLIVFVGRLLRVYKSLEFVDNSFAVNAITRLMVLTSISLIMTFLDVLSFVIHAVSEVKYKRGFTYVILLDVFTNFLCVSLSYAAFKNYYTAICSCYDHQCRICWTKVIECCNKEKHDKVNEMIGAHIHDHKDRKHGTDAVRLSVHSTSNQTESVNASVEKSTNLNL